jgi:hypothetical protein
VTTPVSVLAVDPGCERSAACYYAAGEVFSLGIYPNEMLRCHVADAVDGVTLVLESVESYGMPVGREVFRTVFWSGRFAERWTGARAPVLMPRRLVKLTLCGTSRAKDANVRQAVIDVLGEPPTKARPNPAYPRRPVKDEWSAIALALTYDRLVREGREGEVETLDADPLTAPSAIQSERREG